MLVELSTSKDSKWIQKIITEFENNRVGNNENHKIIREQYFSQEKMKQIQSQIETMIETEPSLDIRSQLLSGYENAVQQEQERVKKCYYNRVNGQESGIDFDATQKRIQLLSGMTTPQPIIIPDEVELGGKKVMTKEKIVREKNKKISQLIIRLFQKKKINPKARKNSVKPGVFFFALNRRSVIIMARSRYSL